MSRPALVLALLGLAIAVRILALDFVTGDTLMWVVPWYEHLLGHGYQALGQSIPNGSGYGELRGNYTPPYYYLLYLATFFEGWAPRLHLVKAVSIAFDLVAALVVYAVGARFGGGRGPALGGALAVLLAPTVVANGALWGQCDAIIVSLLLASLYSSLAERPVATVVCFGVALSFKASAIFLAPYLLLLALRSRLSWRHLAGVPLCYAAMMAPAALLGRPLGELLLVYRDQAGFFGKLSMNAPNLYQFLPDEHYAPLAAAGIALTVLASLGFAIAARRSAAALTPRLLLLAATTSVATAPFLLPKMHDRYFFAADLFSIALAVVDRAKWPVAALFQVSSGLAYLPIISDVLNNFEGEYTALNPLAAAINTGLVVYLVSAYGRALSRPDAGAGVSS